MSPGEDRELQDLITIFGQAEWQLGLMRHGDIKDYREIFIECTVARKNLIEYLESKYEQRPD